ncbi:MAG: hypothetical protein ABR500_12210 [Dermatophilaceae bacterium]
MSFLTEHVHRNRVAAVESMTVLAGASSACAIARDGGSFPAYKFHEGRAAALGALARGLRRGERSAADLVADLGRQWRAEVELRADQSRDWQAYAAGGLDAVREIEDVLSVDPEINREG